MRTKIIEILKIVVQNYQFFGRKKIPGKSKDAVPNHRWRDFRIVGLDKGPVEGR